MEATEALAVIGRVNAFVQSQSWMDFDVVEYRHAKLVVRGALSASYSPDIEIDFRDDMAHRHLKAAAVACRRR
jgi:hypothetical protein